MLGGVGQRKELTMAGGGWAVGEEWESTKPYNETDKEAERAGPLGFSEEAHWRRWSCS